MRTVIASRAFIEQAKLAPLVAALKGLNIVYLEDIRREFGWADKLWLMGVRAVVSRVWSPRRAQADDPAVVVFTSGSEARPKGVVLSHDNIIANYRQIATVMDFTPADRILNALPLYHTYSFTAGLMLCLLSGTRLFLYLSPLRYRAIPEIAYRRDVTGLYGTSTFLSYYARHANPLDFHAVRYVISGGEKLGEEVARLYLEKFGLRVYEGYGATECAPVIALSTPQCYRPGTVGRVLPGIEHRLERSRGHRARRGAASQGAEHHAGLLPLHQPGRRSSRRARIYGEGWHCTGDVVDIGEDGVVKVVGRLGRFAKIAGEMVSLDEVERIAQHASPEAPACRGRACRIRQRRDHGPVHHRPAVDARRAAARCARAGQARPGRCAPRGLDARDPAARHRQDGLRYPAGRGHGRAALQTIRPRWCSRRRSRPAPYR